MAATVTVVQGQGEFPIGISPVSIPSTIGECPSDDSRQHYHNLLQNATRRVIYDTAHTPDPVSQICGPGSWRRAFYLNATVSDQSCPGDWNLVTSPVRGCGGADVSCRSAFSDDINTTYSKVCGRIIGQQRQSTDAFNRFIWFQNTIEDNYLDGVSVTHGVHGSRTHIWSFGATAHVNFCPCEGSAHPPAGVGNKYFCDRNDALDDLLWTGENCASDNPCCTFHNPPYFSVQLPAATTDRIELRICIDQGLNDENVLVLFAEIYVQ